MKSILCLFTFSKFIKTIPDDCVYRYFVCTERLGSWPNNNKRCTQLFKECCKYIEESVDNTEDHGNVFLTTIAPQETSEMSGATQTMKESKLQ